jgi:hypothetical protein
VQEAQGGAISAIGLANRIWTVGVHGQEVSEEERTGERGLSR